MANYTNPTMPVWQNKDSHVDPSINANGSFVNSAHVLVYAAIHQTSATNGETFSTEFKPLGVIQGWSLTEQRQVEEVFELGSDIRYIIPGRTTGQIALTRLLVNGNDLLNIFYANSDPTKKIASLKEVNKAIDLMFVSYENTTNEQGQAAPHIIRYFDNCWIVARQESITANQVVIAENCTITYEKIVNFSTGGAAVDLQNGNVI